MVTGLHAVQAQPGNIFLNSTGVGADSVMDPGLNDYITASGDTFSTSIIDESEEFDATYNVVWHYTPEPTNDIQTGSSCGSTEIVDNPNTNEHAAYYRFIDPDGTLGNGDELLMFRMRIAQNPGSAAFGYSFLIDTDLKFGNTGLNADTNYTSGNPGFEREVLYGSGNNNGVKVLDVDGHSAANQYTLIASYPNTTRHQRAYARFSNCSGDPVFMDFYFDFADLGISVNDPFRLAFATSSSPNTALGGSASDIGGANDGNFTSDDEAFVSLVSNTPTLSISGGYSCVSTFTLSNDTTICSGDTVTLAVTLSSPPSGVSYLWSSGDTTSSISISPNASSVYRVSISDSVGTCVDSIVVSTTNACLGNGCATYLDSCVVGDTIFYTYTYALIGEGFESDSDGWTINGTVTPATRYEGGPVLGGDYFLGRYGTDILQKTFLLDGKSHRVAFDVYRLDSWDGESLKIYVGDGTLLLINQSFVMSSSGQTYSGSSNGYSYTMVSSSSIHTPYLGAPGSTTWKDQVIRIYIDIPSGNESLTLKITSTLNQGLTDESWGLDNFSITCTQFEVPVGIDSVDVWVVGGGGGGGTNGGLGGGGGEIRHGVVDVSSISTLTALPARGGRGDFFGGDFDNQGDASKIYNGSSLLVSANGGSGGGGYSSSGNNAGGTGGSGGIGIQGASGGAGVNGSCSTGGVGSDGTVSDISCLNEYYAGGGGGGIGVNSSSATPFLGPAGGLGGGGRGG